MSFEDALAKLIQKKEELDFLPSIKKVDFNQGGDYQLGEMTWDHENASLTITYTDPRHTPGKRRKFEVDFEYYNIRYDQDFRDDGPPGRTGFAGFMEDLLAAEKDAN